VPCSAVLVNIIRDYAPFCILTSSLEGASNTSPVIHLRASEDLVKFSQPGLPLFQTCREIYAEASSTFYSNNTFTITTALTKVLGKHDFPHDVNGANLVQNALDWMEELPTRAPLVRKLAIDLEGLCPPECRRRHSIAVTKINQHEAGLVDVRPLLWLAWTKYPKLDLSLVYQDNTIHKVCLRELKQSNSLPRRMTLCSPAVKDALQLLQQDSLKIKRFLRSIASIGISRDGRRGVLLWIQDQQLKALSDGEHFDLETAIKQPPGAYMDRASRFTFSPSVTVQWRAGPRRNLFTLPHYLRTHPIRFSLVHPETQVISSAKAPAIASAMGLISLARKTGSTYKTANKFVVELKSTQPTSVLPDVDEIGDILWQIQDASREVKENRMAAWPKIDYWSSARVTMLFELDTLDVTDLSGVSFDATPLVRATLGLHPSKKILVMLRASDAITKQVVDRSKGLSFGQIRSAVQDAWSNFHASQPAGTATGDPRVWMNGLGEVVGVEAVDP
jgi:hypothetical protein